MAGKKGMKRADMIRKGGKELGKAGAKYGLVAATLGSPSMQSARLAERRKSYLRSNYANRYSSRIKAVFREEGESKRNKCRSKSVFLRKISSVDNLTLTLFPSFPVNGWRVFRWKNAVSMLRCEGSTHFSVSFVCRPPAPSPDCPPLRCLLNLYSFSLLVDLLPVFAFILFLFFEELLVIILLTSVHEVTEKSNQTFISLTFMRQ